MSTGPHLGGASGIGGGPNAPLRVTTLSAGPQNTCGVTTAGALRCWGAGANYARGSGATSNSSVPVDMMSLSSGVLAVSAGASTCALTTGAVTCWSVHESSLLGPNSGSRAPVAVGGISPDVASLSVGTDVACVVTALGAVRCWGSAFPGGYFASFSAVPVDVIGLSSGMVSVSAGLRHACAVTALGGVKCWGQNHVGQLGSGALGYSNAPVDVVGLSSGVVSVSAGYDYSCAVTSVGAVKCWGGNYYRQLGNGAMTFSSVPVDVVGLSSGVVSVSAGTRYTCAVTSAGAIQCWGSLQWGEVGDPTTTSTSAVPAEVDGLSSNMSAVSVGDSHACAVTTVGAVKCWGTNSFGELGNGTTNGSPVPVDVVEF